MRAYIYTGGVIDPAYITEHPKGEDLVIAADSGWENAKKLGEKPTVLLGDFDSLGEPQVPNQVEVIRVPKEKDLTDTQLAVDYALQKGFRDIVLIGGLSGRLDHTLSNLAILEHLETLRVHALMTDGFNRVRFIRNNSTLIPRGAYTYLSLIAADPVVKGVEIDGVRYPLKKAKLTRSNQYAISNELTGNCAFIAVRKGGLYIIESRDAKGL
ncbi:MAG: thiamine diphosphokinase [Ruminococcaceae bacterium]|nr:thiamine diphosphokinase [Oscillospiraceae bacterium]